MSRTPLIIVAALAMTYALVVAAGVNPHMDPSVLPAGCASCHRGHGKPQSPMLGEVQGAMCLTCHGTITSFQQAVSQGLVAANAEPALLGSVFTKPNVHPVSLESYSSQDLAAVVCTSCHGPHRSMPPRNPPGTPSGAQAQSPKDPATLEYQLCEQCHGARGVTTQSRVDISRQLNPTNRSFHPVEAPAGDRSPSVLANLSGRHVNCTDCHGNDDAQGARGPHGSGVPGLLSKNYVTTDGASESAAAYALCYGCHGREAVLNSTRFPGHSAHVVDERASCATCHNGHGAVTNRALIRFGEEVAIAGVSATAMGELKFVSSGPGSGSCYLVCHGKVHDPLSYGAGDGQHLPAPARPIWVLPPSRN